MKDTVVTASFTDADTIQLRFELGSITDAVATRQVPDFQALDEGWIWQDGWIGRVQLSGETFMPVEVYNASAIDPLFDSPGGETANRVATIDQKGFWKITVNGAEVGVDGLSRKSNILDTATVGWGEFEFRTLQNVFLDIDAPLTVGDEIVVQFNDPSFEAITATYAPSEIVSETIHVNLTGYDPDDARKIAFLSSWNGWSSTSQETVSQVYDGPLAFRVMNADTGAVALLGETTLSTPASQTTDFERNYALTDVWEMDMSALTDVGTYYIDVDGVGRSQSFKVNDAVWRDVFETSFSGFYHQRSGIALDTEYTDWVRGRSLHPEDGRVTVYATTLPLSETDDGYDQSKPDQFGPLVAAATDDVLPGAWGGWHDAGDWDRRTQHLEATRKLTDLVEIASDWAEGVRAKIPENNNGLPDLLDEALWNLDFFARLQTDEGGVRGGIEGDDYRGYGANSAEEVHTLYAYAPDTWTSWEFAASAAKMSRVIAAYDQDAAAVWLARAQRAMAWAEDRVPENIDATQATSRNLAAAELYATTDNEQWHDLFLQTSNYRDPNANLAWNEYQYEAAITYNRLDPAKVDAAVAQRGFDALQGQADFLLSQGRDGGFGFLADPFAPYGWGTTASQPNTASDYMVALHNLTGDARYLEAIQGDVQYALGANPMNMAFMTGLDGVRSPEIILNADADSMGGKPPPGITLYGDYNVYDYGLHFSYNTMWNEIFPNPYETPVHESFNGFYLFVPSAEYTVQQGITDMTYATGYLASQSGPVTDPPPTEEPVDLPVERPVDTPDETGSESETIFFDGTAFADGLIGTSGMDVMQGRYGNDNLDGAAGNDVLTGGYGEDWLFGGPGDDEMRGGRGNDGMAGGDGADTLLGGKGNDTGWAGDGNDSLRGNAGNDTLYGEYGDDRLQGGRGDDRLDGGAGMDCIDGGRGRDSLFGGAGNDKLHGGSGADVLDGQWGDDVLRGGAGADVFVFDHWYGTDTIKDFGLGEDMIDLTGLRLETGFETIAASLSGYGGRFAVLSFADQQTTIRLQDIEAADLTADHFIF